MLDTEEKAICQQMNITEDAYILARDGAPVPGGMDEGDLDMCRFMGTDEALYAKTKAALAGQERLKASDMAPEGELLVCRLNFDLMQPGKLLGGEYLSNLSGLSGRA